jgi:hypothetical protein
MNYYNVDDMFVCLQKARFQLSSHGSTMPLQPSNVESLPNHPSKIGGCRFRARFASCSPAYAVSSASFRLPVRLFWAQ